MSDHKTWLDNEYSQWIKALQESTVHNFKEHPMVKRMLSLDMEGDWFKRIDDNVNWEILYKIHFIGCSKREDHHGLVYMFRMIYYAQEILKRNPSSVCEIGGGVGQFYAILRALGYRGEYIIIDLPEVQEFQKKYLVEVSRQTGLNTDQFISEVPQMVVSFYALGEFDNILKELYSEVINSATYGYIAWNPHSGASDDLSLFKHDIKVTPGIEPGIKIIQW